MFVPVAVDTFDVGSEGFLAGCINSDGLGMGWGLRRVLTCKRKFEAVSRDDFLHQQALSTVTTFRLSTLGLQTPEA